MKQKKSNKEYFKNRPQQFFGYGIFGGLFIGCIGAFFIETLEVIDKMTSLIGITATNYDWTNFIIFGLGSILSFIISHRLKRKIYYEVEQNLDD